MTPLKRAINKAGSAKELARRLGVTPQAISQWKMVPITRVLAVEMATGINRSDLRPDIYPPDLGGRSTPERGMA